MDVAHLTLPILTVQTNNIFFCISNKWLMTYNGSTLWFTSIQHKTPTFLAAFHFQKVATITFNQATCPLLITWFSSPTATLPSMT